MDSRSFVRPLRSPYPWIALLLAFSFLIPGTRAALAGKTAAVVASHPAQSCSNIKRGGTFVYGVDQDVVSFDSVNTQDNGSLWADMNIYDQLVRLTPSATALEPDLAQTWTVQQGGRVMIFHLRHNARFSDGTPVTAADVKFTWDLVLNPKAVNNWTLQAVKSDTVVDPYTFKVVLKKPWAPFLNDITLWGASIYSKKAYLKEGKTFLTHPVGSGPFAVEKFLPGQYVLLKRNPYYWERDACGHQYPYVDAIKLEYLPNDNTRLVKLEGGAIDAMVDLPYNLISAVGHMPGITAASTPQLGVYAVGLNQKKFAPFRDNKVVQAMNYAIDRDAIVRVVFFGHAKPALSPIDEGVNYWTGKYGYTYNLSLAKKLMAASKYPHGFKVTMLTNAGSTVYAGIATIMQSELKQIGIQMAIRPLDVTTSFATQQKEDYQMAMGNGTSDNIDPNENMEYCCVSNGGADSGYTGWKDPKADALYFRSQTAMSSSLRARLLDQWQKIVMKELPTIWLVYPTNSFAYRNNVHGFFVQNTAHWPLWVVWKS